MHGLYGTQHAELEVQRTIKRAELAAFLCLFRSAIGPTMVQVDNKGIIDGQWKGEVTCIGPRRFVDRNLGRIEQFAPKRNIDRGGACQSAPCREGKAAKVALRKVYH